MKKRLSTNVAIIIVLITLIVFTSYGCFGMSKEIEELPKEAISEEEQTDTNNNVIEDNTEDEKESSEQVEEVKEEEEQGVNKNTDLKNNIVEGYAYTAILKGINLGKNTITVEQLINEPNQAEIGDVLELSKDCTVKRIIVIRNGEEKEYSKDISLKEVALNTEIGIIFKENLVDTIISSFMIDTSIPLSIEQIKPLEGEYMVAALLKAIDTGSSTITVEQLMNEPNEKIISPEVKLASDYKVYKSILITSGDGEREYTAEISINEIPLDTEIGIGFTKDNLAKIIISQEWFED